MTMIITDRPGGTHSLPTEWLGKRVVGWMFDEAGPAPWWVCALTREGEWRYATHHPMGSEPDAEHKEYARKICTHIHRVANHGGAWLVAWIDNSPVRVLNNLPSQATMSPKSQCLKSA